MLISRQLISLALRNGWTVETNNRSSHDGVNLIGGGAAVVFPALATWLVFTQPIGLVDLAVLAGAVALAIVSWIDDRKMVHPGLRLALHIIAVALVLSVLPAEQRILPDDWPLLIERLLTGFCWVWIINLYNFMDGIDGIAACETIAICLGLFLIGNITLLPADMLILAVALGGASLGFLPWNWHPSRIMLGDLGAIPIGFLIGFLLLKLAIEGYLIAALILPLYFLVDASITLLRRILSGEKFWHPHKEHFYQRMVQAGHSHDRIVLKVIGANIILIGVALWSISQPLWAAIVAIGVVAVLLVHFHLKAQK